MNIRPTERVISAMETSDGAGVRLRRSLGQSQWARLDPFLLLDEFNSDDPDDYIGGFPSHPHRGFETVTYMLAGRMLHEDHMGNRGELEPGAVQWMTAAGGIIHSEMPQQQDGLLRGFQLWVNLPGSLKMAPACYRDIKPEDIPQVRLSGGGSAKIIAGHFESEDKQTVGAVASNATDVDYFDLNLIPGEVFECAVASDRNAFFYVYDGQVRSGEPDQATSVDRWQAALLGAGDYWRVEAGDQGAGILFLSAIPTDEPVAQQGPFVMNTREEVEQAMRDYRDGTLTADGG
ncbi:MAG: pirin family protein [Gammaproteobacteria bacterium]|nr:pirin family protein [Gammaproteobacteria bacterium]